jgi:imidazolonepropionase-like amidohydrolase
MQGIGFHWELRMFASSNMSNYDVLRAATINPARALGLDDQIGSVVVGKLADLLFYKAEDNPLSDIWNAAKIDLVLKDGHLYKAATLEQILPESVPAPTLPVINTPKL